MHHNHSPCIIPIRYGNCVIYELVFVYLYMVYDINMVYKNFSVIKFFRIIKIQVTERIKLL